MLSLDSRDSRPIGVQVADGLRRLLLAGAYAPGDNLPPAPVLAARMAVNPLAVRGAYQALMDEGLLTPCVTGGPQVTGKAAGAGRDELLRRWDKTTLELLVLGCSRGELQKRLKEVGA